MQQKLDDMETELSSLQQDVQRYEERQEKEEKVGRPFFFFFSRYSSGTPCRKPCHAIPSHLTP